jgi:hypothetical protein
VQVRAAARAAKGSGRDGHNHDRLVSHYRAKSRARGQSRAFFRTPGMLWLNSGAQRTRPSASAIAASRSCTVAGRRSLSRFWL